MRRVVRIQHLPEGLRHLVASNLTHEPIGEVIERDSGILEEVRVHAMLGERPGSKPVEDECLAGARKRLR